MGRFYSEFYWMPDELVLWLKGVISEFQLWAVLWPAPNNARLIQLGQIDSSLFSEMKINFYNCISVNHIYPADQFGRNFMKGGRLISVLHTASNLFLRFFCLNLMYCLRAAYQYSKKMNT